MFYHTAARKSHTAAFSCHTANGTSPAAVGTAIAAHGTVTAAPGTATAACGTATAAGGTSTAAYGTVTAACGKCSVADVRGYMIINGDLRPLPIGSTLAKKAGKFYWSPGPGFYGKYDLVFLIKDSDGQWSKKIIEINIGPSSD
jgi:hypothetical protein